MYVFPCQTPVPREHLPSCNVIIMDLYNLDLLSWSNGSLWSGDRNGGRKRNWAA